MKVVSRNEYLAFIAKLDSGIEEAALDAEPTAAIQSVDPAGEVRAQVLYFKHAAPQFMIGTRTAWTASKRGARSLDDVIGITEDSLGG